MSIPRAVAGALALALLIPVPCRSQERPTLTLADAIAAAHERNPELAAALLASEAQGHRIEQAGKWPNPELSAYRESFPGAVPGADQWIVSLSQRIRLGGQGGLASDAAAAEHRATRWDAATVRADLALRVQRQYAATHADQERKGAVEAALEVTRRLLRDLRLRRDEGDVSPFDVQRMALEVEALQVRLAELSTALRNGWTRLATLTGIEEPADGWRLEQPDRQPMGPAAAREVGTSEMTATDAVRDLSEHPEVRAAAARADAAALRETLARRRSVPDLVVTGGYSRIDPGEDGFVWSISAVVPLFDRNRDGAAAAAAEESSLRRRADVLERQARSRLLQARRAHRDAAAALDELAPPADPGLVDIAHIAYQEGEMGMVELLDAVDAELAASLRRIDLEQRRNDRWFVWKWAAGEAVPEENR